MKFLFTKNPSLDIRLVIAVSASVALMVSDGQSERMIKARNVMETAISGLYYLANTPRVVLDEISDVFIASNNLQIENKALKSELLKKNSDLLLLEQFKVENQRLRLLLNSPLRQNEYKQIAEVLIAETDIYRQQAVINLGQNGNAHIGQPVIDEKGVVGQIISVGANTSRVLLITDSAHAIPLQVLRNDVRVIANGTGRIDQLMLENVTDSMDIKEGDLLVTSGLGGRYPEGYPVAVVETVVNNGKNAFSTVIAKPLASLERLRYLLVLWTISSELKKFDSISPQDVRDAVRQRIQHESIEPTSNGETDKNLTNK